MFSGQTAVVTGGSRGIGRAVVERLAGDGAAVAFSWATNEAAAQDVEAAATSAGATVMGLQADLGRIDSIRTLFADADSALGGLDIVVLNAAITGGDTITEVDEADYDRVMDTNAKGTFFALQEAARRVRDGGRIIAVSSINTVLPVPGNALYSASKAAVEQFAAIAARELGGRQVTVNTVSPGATDTDLLRSANSPEALPRMAALSPLGRLGTPADVADVIAFLAGAQGRWLTGQNLHASGGLA